MTWTRKSATALFSERGGSTSDRYAMPRMRCAQRRAARIAWESRPESVLKPPPRVQPLLCAAHVCAVK